MSSPILELRNLEKSFLSYWLFKKMPAVKNVSFRLPEGAAYGFLGHNGAGKTTTLKCITGILKPNAGDIFFEGVPLSSVQQREKIGFLPEYPYFYDHLSVRESLSFFSKLYGMRGRDAKNRITDVLEQVGLAHKTDAKIRTLSKGLQQRLGLAQAILNDPRLLILDEPFSGLDPNGRADVRGLIIALQNKGTSILMSSHILSDVEEICSMVGIMSQGTLVTEFSLADAEDLFPKRYCLSIGAPREEVLSVSTFAELLSSEQIEFEENSNRLGLTTMYLPDTAAAETALRAALAADLSVQRFDSIGQKLEEIYLSVTSRESSAEAETL